MVYPGILYRPPFPLSNGCPFDQLATITYPISIPMTGPDGSSPTNVSVPPGTITEWLRLQFPPDTVSTPNGFCSIETGVLTAIHQQTGPIKVPGGWYTCFEVERNFLVSACVSHGQSGDDGGGGGGGKPKKPSAAQGPPAPNSMSSNPCASYWTTNRFVGTSEVPTPDSCTGYIRQQAQVFFSQYLQANRAADPAQWAWLPTDSAIDSLSAAQIMALKLKALVQILQSAN